MRFHLARAGTLIALITMGCAPGISSTPTPSPSASPTVTPTLTSLREVTIGALVDLTGNNASAGQSIQAGLQVALEDVNQYLADQQASVRLKMVIADGASDKDVALEQLQSFDAQGVKLVIGPDSSTSLAHVKDYANQHGMVLISPSSTAPSLALEDNVLRTAPVDVLQAHAIAMLMHDQGIKSLVTVHRDDTWGNELNRELGLAATVFSVNLKASQSYSVTASSYTSAIASLSATVNQAVGQVGSSSVGVGLISFDEARDIFLAAKDDPVLKDVRWFGCDGNALSPAITGTSGAATFAAQTKFMAATFLNPFDAGNPQATRSTYIRPVDAVKAGIQAKLGGAPNEYALTAYDSLWLAGLASKQLDGSAEAPRVITALWEAALEFRGASGAMSLNPACDRTRGDYGFFGVLGNAWERRAVYHDPNDLAGLANAPSSNLTYEGGTP